MSDVYTQINFGLWGNAMEEIDRKENADVSKFGIKKEIVKLKPNFFFMSELIEYIRKEN